MGNDNQHARVNFSVRYKLSYRLGEEQYNEGKIKSIFCNKLASSRIGKLETSIQDDIRDSSFQRYYRHMLIDCDCINCIKTRWISKVRQEK